MHHQNSAPKRSTINTTSLDPADSCSILAPTGQWPDIGREVTNRLESRLKLIHHELTDNLPDRILIRNYDRFFVTIQNELDLTDSLD